MNQLLLGALIGFAASAVWYTLRRGRVGMPWLIAAPLATLACALWAVVPDMPRALGMMERYNRWAHDPAMNVFFWHYSIDLAERDSPWYAVGIVAVAAALMGVAWRELRNRERARTWPT